MVSLTSGTRLSFLTLIGRDRLRRLERKDRLLISRADEQASAIDEDTEYGLGQAVLDGWVECVPELGEGRCVECRRAGAAAGAPWHADQGLAGAQQQLAVTNLDLDRHPSEERNEAGASQDLCRQLDKRQRVIASDTDSDVRLRNCQFDRQWPGERIAHMLERADPLLGQ